MRTKLFLCFNNNIVLCEDLVPAKCIYHPKWLSKAVVLLLMNHCLIELPFIVGKM